MATTQKLNPSKKLPVLGWKIKPSAWPSLPGKLGPVLQSESALRAWQKAQEASREAQNSPTPLPSASLRGRKAQGRRLEGVK